MNWPKTLLRVRQFYTSRDTPLSRAPDNLTLKQAQPLMDSMVKRFLSQLAP